MAFMVLELKVLLRCYFTMSTICMSSYLLFVISQHRRPPLFLHHLLNSFKRFLLSLRCSSFCRTLGKIVIFIRLRLNDAFISFFLFSFLRCQSFCSIWQSFSIIQSSLKYLLISSWDDLLHNFNLPHICTLDFKQKF